MPHARHETYLAFSINCNIWHGHSGNHDCSKRRPPTTTTTTTSTTMRELECEIDSRRKSKSD